MLLLNGMDLVDIGRRQWKRDLVAWATRVANEFWETHAKYKNGDGGDKEYGEYGVRVRESFDYDGSVVQGKGGGNKGKSMMYDTMWKPKGNSFHMPAQKLKDAKDWELEAIMKAEDEFQIVRRCSDDLKVMQGPTQGYA